MSGIGRLSGEEIGVAAYRSRPRIARACRTVFVLGANVDTIRDTPVFQKLLSRMPLPQLDEFTQRTGLDPRKDLSQVLTCSNGKTGLLLARGKFKAQELEARLASNGAKQFAYKKFSLFGDERGAFFVWNASTVIAGPDSRFAIDHRSTGHAPACLWRFEICCDRFRPMIRFTLDWRAGWRD